jgi:hypothetical protein
MEAGMTAGVNVTIFNKIFLAEQIRDFLAILTYIPATYAKNDHNFGI